MFALISLGTNIGSKIENLSDAKLLLSQHSKVIEESRIYSSKAVDYLDQPDFLNQVICLEKPNSSPQEFLDLVLSIEKKMGRKRDIPKGPRVIDIDILFWGLETLDSPNLQIPHPRLFERSFIVLPLRELKVFKTLSNKFNFATNFCNDAFPLESV